MARGARLRVTNPRCIISFSLYGQLPLYTDGAIANAELAHRFYPGWTTRFYVDDTVPADVVAALRERQADIVRVTAPSLGPLYGRYWRFWIAAEPHIERFIVRDADSRLNAREQAAVDDWIQSGKSFHVMRDNVAHAKRVLAGMWGATGNKLPQIRPLTDSWGHYSQQGENDRFMSEVIFPLISDDYICHDGHGHFPDAIPFPPHEPMTGTSFVGEIVTPAIERQGLWRRISEQADAIAQYRDALDARDIELNAAKERVSTLASAVDQRDRALRESQERLSRLIHQLELSSAPRSLRAVLPLARLLRKCSLPLRRSAKTPGSGR